MSSKRNAYHRPVTADWWRKTGFYRFYMLREGTALPALLFSVELIFGLYALKHGAESWAAFVNFLQHPVLLLLNLIALAAALLHSKTWFELAPKASIIVIGDKKLSSGPIVKSLWLAMALISLAMLAAVLLVREG
ncbi:fumarate reductase subunit C [Erwinia persicina]|jgi:fumarate reductase subunit C|uniref:Fumarate reductase subunit C n=2 Tax=Erwinia TaxID=551 RepID=A0ABV4E5I2_9GAMM|nr:fumarate reductase subunit FrdC [Erwinia persicina]MCP1438539.1 fumarate reductase subunit C [Erwinia persicina]